MKKLFLILLVLLMAAGSLFAAGIELGDFPLGKWLDSRWGAVWEFSSGNIRILNLQGDVVYDFDGKTINDFTVKPGTGGLVLSFSCEESGRKYQFTKPLTNLNLKMVIDKNSGSHYEAELPIQR